MQCQKIKQRTTSMTGMICAEKKAMGAISHR
jgi:hypothetical protein